MASVRRGIYSPAWGLSKALATALLALSVFILLVSGGVRLIAYLKYNQEAITSRQQAVARVAQQSVTDFIQDKISTLRTASWIADPYALTPAAQKELLQKIAGLQPSFKRVLMFNAAGVEVARVSRRSRATEQQRDIPHLAAALRTVRYADRYLSPVFIDSTTNEPAMLLALPLRDAVGTDHGTLIAELNLKFMWEVVAAMKLGESGEAYVVDKTGALVAHGDPSRVLRGADVRHLECVAQYTTNMALQGGAASIYRSLDGRLVVGVYVPMKEPEWAVVVEVPWAEAYAATIRETIINLVLFVLLAGLAAWLGVRIARRLSEPIVRLRDTAGLIAKGERGLQAEIAGPREIVELATAFNSMTNQLNGTLVRLEREVKEVQRAENALRAKSDELDVYFTNALDLLCIADMNGILKMLNREWEATLGYAVDDLLGRSFLEFVHPEDLQATLGAVSRLSNQEAVLNFENRYRCKDGSYRWIEWRSRPVGRLIYAAARDVTDRKRAEERVRELNEKLEQRVAERTQQLENAIGELEAFSYSVSHDLHAPLRAVDGFSRVLIEDFGPSLSSEAQHICGVIRQETQRMGTLIDDLLRFSRLGRAAMSLHTIDMSALAREAFITVTTMEDRARIDLTLRDLPAVVGDLPMMRQVWVNLISNAVKFSSKIPRASIEVSGCRQDGECVFSVRDNGAGFDAKHATRLFGVFQRLHSTREFGGTGAGLAIVQRIIQRHGGRIWAESELGKGAVFYFAIPCGSS